MENAPAARGHGPRTLTSRCPEEAVTLSALHRICILASLRLAAHVEHVVTPASVQSGQSFAGPVSISYWVAVLEGPAEHSCSEACPCTRT